MRAGASGRGYAPFLAQLIATRERAAQTREKRRASPGAASAAYRDALSRRRPYARMPGYDA
jgi:hypothetical protein